MHVVRPRPNVGEAVVAVDVRRGAALTDVEQSVVVRIQEDRHAGQTRFADVLDAVAVRVLELRAANRDQPEVAEGHAGDIGAAAGHDVGRIGRGLRETGRQYFVDVVRSRPNVGEAVVAVGVRRGTGLTDVEQSVVVRIQEDRHPLQPQFTGVLDAVAVRVRELRAADRDQLEVAEVDSRNGLAGGQHKRGGVRRRLYEAGLLHFTDAVRPRKEFREAVVAVGVRRGTRLPRIEQAVVVVIQEDGHAGQSELTGVLDAIAVRVLKLHAGDAAHDAIGNGDDVVIQSHGAISRQGAAIHGRAGVHGDARQRENMSFKRRGGPQSRRTADLPIDGTRVTAIDHHNLRVAGSCQRAPDLKNELRIGVSLGVEGERPGQLSRRRKEVDSRRERLPAQILTGQGRGARPTRQDVVRRGDVVLGLDGNRIGRVDRPIGDKPRRKAGDCGAGADTQVAVNDGWAGVGHRRTSQNREAVGRPQKGRQQQAVLQQFDLGGHRPGAAIPSGVLASPEVFKQPINDALVHVRSPDRVHLPAGNATQSRRFDLTHRFFPSDLSKERSRNDSPVCRLSLRERTPFRGAKGDNNFSNAPMPLMCVNSCCRASAKAKKIPTCNDTPRCHHTSAYLLANPPATV